MSRIHPFSLSLSPSSYSPAETKKQIQSRFIADESLIKGDHQTTSPSTSHITSHTMASQTFEWRPAKLLQEYDSPQDFALLILNQPLKNGVNLRKLWKNCT